MTDGYKLVPRDPTRAMLDAGYDAGVEWGDTRDNAKHQRRVWSAMLAAAPEPLRVGREDVAKAISPEYAPPWPRADREFLSVVWAETLNSAERVLALIEPSAGGGWRPIETAPKDKGPIVVAFSPEDWTTAEAVWRDGEWRAACWFVHRASKHFESREHVVKPVYWQPRPVRSTPDQPKQEVKDV